MSYRTVVCGVTGSEASHKAAEEAARLAVESGAALVLVYAVDAGFLKGMTIQLTPDYAEKTLQHLGGHILDQVAELVAPQGIAPKKVLRVGPVLQVLKDVVAEEKADLLVLGHEERSFFEKVLFGGKVEDHVQELTRETGVAVKIVQ